MRFEDINVGDVVRITELRDYDIDNNVEVGEEFTVTDIDGECEIMGHDSGRMICEQLELVEEEIEEGEIMKVKCIKTDSELFNLDEEYLIDTVWVKYGAETINFSERHGGFKEFPMIGGFWAFELVEPKDTLLERVMFEEFGISNGDYFTIDDADFDPHLFVDGVFLDADGDDDSADMLQVIMSEERIPQKVEFVLVTMEDIAEKFGVDVESLMISE